MRVTGLRESIRKLHAYPTLQVMEVAKTFRKSGRKIVTNASSKLIPLPHEKGDIIDSINRVRKSIAHHIVVQNDVTELSIYAGGTGETNMAAYLEFGTGKYAQAYLSTNRWLSDWASQFIVNKKGTLQTRSYIVSSVREEFPNMYMELENTVEKTWKTLR